MAKSPRMLYAVVLVTVEVATAFSVCNALQQLPFVGLVQYTTAPFDVVVLIQAKTSKELADTVVYGIQPIQGVRRTLTLVVIEDQLEPLRWLKGT